MFDNLNEEQQQAARIALYDGGVKLLELLNVFLTKMDKLEAKVPAKLLEDLSNLSCEIGANVVLMAPYIAEGEGDEKEVPEEKEDEDEKYFGYYGC